MTLILVYWINSFLKIENIFLKSLNFFCSSFTPKIQIEFRFCFKFSRFILIDSWSRLLHFLLSLPHCFVSGALTKWMLCLHHVLVLWSDSSFCLVQYCYLGRSFCVCLCVWFFVPVCQFWGPAGSSEFVRIVFCVCVCLSDVMMKVAAVSCCFWAKHTVLNGWMNWLNRCSQLFFLQSPILTPSGSPHSQCVKDSRSRRQWWGTYQCEPECRLVPLQAGTHINTDMHIHTDG